MPAISPPSQEDIKASRRRVQTTKEIGITAAQDWCADQVHTTRRAWQQWESGSRGMHPAFWELFNIKIADLERITSAGLQ